MPRTPNPRYVSIEYAAAHVSVCTKTIRRRIAQGSLPAYRTGRVIRVRLDDVEALLRPVPAAGNGEQRAS